MLYFDLMLTEHKMKPFTNDFPCADIHESFSPELLHQLIKSSFNDHGYVAIFYMAMLKGMRYWMRMTNVGHILFEH